MKNAFIVFMNILFIAVVAADITAAKYGCDATPVVVQNSCYQERQAQYHPVVNTADMMISGASFNL